METADRDNCVNHILLTSLGMQARKTEYLWNGKTAKAELTPLALVQLLKLNGAPLPDRVLAVVTKGALGKTWGIFETGIRTTLGFSPQLLVIPDGKNDAEIRDILEKVAAEIPEGAYLTLDVTQGFRHFPFIFYALVLYLTSLRGVKIRGAYYGMEGIAQSAPKPIIDMQPLLELPEWFHAVRVFRDQGTTKPMANLLTTPTDVTWLEKYAFAYESALPLELGNASNNLIGRITGLTRSTNPPPLVTELTTAIVSTAKETAFKTPPSRRGWKTSISLDPDELKRQADMIDLYLDRVQLPLAAGLMREWVVSWVIWKSGNCDDIKNWLDIKLRETYENRIGSIVFSATRGTGPKPGLKLKEFGTFWNHLADNLRNAFHHHGMRENALEWPLRYLRTVRDFWDELKDKGLHSPGKYPFV